MAGNYPDYPSWRLPWDKDGTVLLYQGAEQSSGVRQGLNSEAGTSIGGATGNELVTIFPRLMDIDAYVFNAWGDNPISAPNPWVNGATSVNTTNGQDGTWVSFTPANGGNGIGNRWPTSCTFLGIRAIKISYGTGYGAHAGALQLFGEPTAGEDTNHVSFWHPTLDQRVGPAYFDWGNAQRDSLSTKSFRIKNESSTLTANNVRVAFEALTDTSPTVVSQVAVSADGGTNYYAQRTITSIAPGAISSSLIVRRSVAANAVLGLWTIRIIAEASSWT